MGTIRDILAFVNDDIDTPLSIALSRICEELNVAPRGLCMSLLHWLRARASRKRRFPLYLRNLPASHALRMAVSGSGPLSGLFEISNDAVNFRPEIDSTTMDEIEAEVLARYRPVMFAD